MPQQMAQQTETEAKNYQPLDRIEKPEILREYQRGPVKILYFKAFQNKTRLEIFRDLHDLMFSRFSIEHETIRRSFCLITNSGILV